MHGRLSLPEDLNPDHILFWRDALEFCIAGRYQSIEELIYQARDEYFRLGGEMRTSEPQTIVWED